jgi:branched-chain amino acid transport system permease protein
VPGGLSLERLARLVWVPFILCLGLVALWAIIDNLTGNVYQRTLLITLIYLVLVLGLQVFSGNSGVLSFGHVAFVAIGAYTSALLTIPPEIKKATFLTMPGFLHWILDTELGAIEATLAGAGVAMVFGILFAPAIVRLGGVQAGIGTLAILVVVYVFNIQTTSITRGTSTMIGVPSTTSMTTALVWALIAVVGAYVFQQSGRGLRLRATRENARAARSVRISVPFERGVAWTLSTFVAGVAGALYGHFIVAFSPTSFYFDVTFITITMLVVGGMTSVSGAVVGCIFLAVVQEALRRFEVNGLGPIEPGDVPTGTTQLGLAIILLLTLILRPKGITAGREIPWPGDWSLPRRRGRRPPVPVEPGAPVPDRSRSAETAGTD